MSNLSVSVIQDLRVEYLEWVMVHRRRHVVWHGPFYSQWNLLVHLDFV